MVVVALMVVVVVWYGISIVLGTDCTVKSLLSHVIETFF